MAVRMVTLELKTEMTSVDILRMTAVVLTCITFSLVASVFHTNATFWTYCMFTWCFCFCVTILIMVLEFTSLSTKLPISWNDFTTAFAMLATMMVLVASIVYPRFYICLKCGRQICASVTSCLCFILYTAEVILTRSRSGEVSGFMSTVPGLLKVLEAFVACIIFICLENIGDFTYAGLHWCVAVYSICFVSAIFVIILTICRLLTVFPGPLDKVLLFNNLLAVLMYSTAAVIWPLYSFRNNPRPSICDIFPYMFCGWDLLVVITALTVLNLIAYIVDSVYCFRMVFFDSST
uniref:Myeloid-associated differentiation marker homolog n=1 Tax=Acanthochromis polyacanthus TaxID=80966 RepID=A0A3Q1FHB3_9TELE